MACLSSPFWPEFLTGCFFLDNVILFGYTLGRFSRTFSGCFMAFPRACPKNRRHLGQVRHIIDSKQFTDLTTDPVFSTRDFRAVPEKYRFLIPEYVKEYVSLNQFAVQGIRQDARP